eukprot:Lankesteria_metandrocarpae@DN5701_c0_g1_i1.p1
MTTDAERFRWLDCALRAVAYYHQVITCNMWTRNGIHVKQEAEFYVRSIWYEFYCDLDLLTLRMSSLVIDSRMYLDSLIDAFELPKAFNVYSGREQEVKWQGLILTFCQLLSSENGLSMNFKERTEASLVYLLLTQNKTNSELHWRMPHYAEPLVVGLMRSISSFKPADTMKPGEFIANDLAWSRYDPCCPHYSWSDQEQAEQRFQQRIKDFPEFIDKWLSPAARVTRPYDCFLEDFFDFTSRPHVQAFVWALGVRVLLAALIKDGCGLGLDTLILALQKESPDCDASPSLDSRTLNLTLHLLLRLLLIDVGRVPSGSEASTTETTSEDDSSALAPPTSSALAPPTSSALAPPTIIVATSNRILSSPQMEVGSYSDGELHSKVRSKGDNTTHATPIGLSYVDTSQWMAKTFRESIRTCVPVHLANGCVDPTVHITDISLLNLLFQCWRCN